MSKKIKIEKLYVVILGRITGSYGNRSCNFLEETCILAHAKYNFFSKAKIKYFVNVFDKTKYFPLEDWEEGLCAAVYTPFTYYFKNLKKSYLTVEEAQSYIIHYNNSPKKSSTANNTVQQKIGIESMPIERNYQTFLPFGKILTDIHFASEPAIAREREIDNLITALAQQKKNPILVGESGVGKTSIVYELAYLIQKDRVPNFLKNRKIIEIHASDIVAGTKYRGDLETKMNSIIDYAKKNNAIIFVDEIHTIYGAGTTENCNFDVAEMLKIALDRDSIKVIGATTRKEYEQYFSLDALKRRFELINIDEPNSLILREIITQVFDAYSNKSGISIDKLDRSIVDILLVLTNPRYRKYDDKICNPDLVIGIIDSAFAIASVRDCSSLTIEHFIYAINKNNRIYESAKKTAIDELNKKIESPEDKKARILKLNMQE